MKPTVAEEFKDALRHFASGVTIVTLRAGEQTHGLTVSAFASVSTEPPLIAIMINHGHQAHAMLEQENAVFAVNILGHDQQELSDRFAWLKDGDRFAEGDWETATTGAPVLANALVWLDCTIHDRVAAGTHTIFIGRVRAARVPRPEEAPLLYWNRDYRELCTAACEEPAIARSA
jgi:flavin reductase (DIM6/NTAB) family NADH-FMN oxidoreductase RutF